MLWFLAAINTFSLTLPVSVVGQTSTPPEMAETYWLTLGSWTQPRKHFSGGVCSSRCERKRFSYSEDKSCCLHYRYHHLDSYVKDCEHPAHGDWRVVLQSALPGMLGFGAQIKHIIFRVIY